MKANELRIGNWFFNGKFNQQVLPTHLDYLLNKNFYPHDAMKPIPLTPEIFYNSGFDEKNTKWRKLLKNGKVSIDMSHYGQTTFAYCYGNHGVIGLDYVHQLQNLYFALTGEELNIEL
jgi:hypothetical protein